MMNAASDLEVLRPDDWHLHLRDGAMLRAVLRFTALARSLMPEPSGEQAP